MYPAAPGQPLDQRKSSTLRDRLRQYRTESSSLQDTEPAARFFAPRAVFRIQNLGLSLEITEEYPGPVEKQISEQQGRSVYPVLTAESDLLGWESPRQ